MSEHKHRWYIDDYPDCKTVRCAGCDEVRSNDLKEDELPDGVEAICEHCGQPAEYNSVLCLCTNCKIEAAST